jgi:hypothetical protein
MYTLFLIKNKSKTKEIDFFNKIEIEFDKKILFKFNQSFIVN